MATESSGLDIGDLRVIVKLCVNFGVKSLKFRGLELEFGVAGDVPVPGLKALNKPVKAITADQHELQAKQALLEDELSVREQQIADLQLTNPLAAEEMIANGELDDDSGDDESDE